MIVIVLSELVIIGHFMLNVCMVDFFSLCLTPAAIMLGLEGMSAHYQ
jgi:hypothetical protein